MIHTCTDTQMPVDDDRRNPKIGWQLRAEIQTVKVTLDLWTKHKATPRGAQDRIWPLVIADTKMPKEKGVNAKNWCFTLNNYTEDELQSIISRCTKGRSWPEVTSESPPDQKWTPEQNLPIRCFFNNSGTSHQTIMIHICTDTNAGRWWLKKPQDRMATESGDIDGQSHFGSMCWSCWQFNRSRA